MTGVSFLTDEMGQKVAVQIDLKEVGTLWDDFYDNLMARQRANEPRESFESVKASLMRQGKLHV
ncbi:hypothetical protein HY793_04765 [Candidatus Desantisbacteria bacterium]|nr:hypothetical protein [Candidatus Desantisbacteria bacterium]